MYVYTHSAAHKTTTTTTIDYKHKSLTLEIYTATSLRTKNNWNNNINNCMYVCVSVCVFSLVDGFFSVCLTVFVLHSASASTSTRAQVSTATAIELSHKQERKRASDSSVGWDCESVDSSFILSHFVWPQAFVYLHFELATSILAYR